MRGPNKDIWKTSLENDLGQLAQGAGTRMPMGTNTVFFIPLSVVPVGRTVTYSRLVASIRPHKTETHRVHVTVGGNRLDFPGDTTTNCASLTTTKCILNSTISTPGIGILCAGYLYSVIESTPSPWDSGSRIESTPSTWDSRSRIDRDASLKLQEGHQVATDPRGRHHGRYQSRCPSSSPVDWFHQGGHQRVLPTCRGGAWLSSWSGWAQTPSAYWVGGRATQCSVTSTQRQRVLPKASQTRS